MAHSPARFRSLAGINRALASGAADLAGVARPLIMDPALAGKWLRGTSAAMPAYTLVRALRIRQRARLLVFTALSAATERRVL